MHHTHPHIRVYVLVYVVEVSHHTYPHIGFTMYSTPGTARVITYRMRIGKAKTKPLTSTYQRKALATGQTVTATREQAARMTRNVGM